MFNLTLSDLESESVKRLIWTAFILIWQPVHDEHRNYANAVLFCCRLSIHFHWRVKPQTAAVSTLHPPVWVWWPPDWSSSWYHWTVDAGGKNVWYSSRWPDTVDVFRYCVLLSVSFVHKSCLPQILLICLCDSPFFLLNVLHRLTHCLDHLLHN